MIRLRPPRTRPTVSRLFRLAQVAATDLIRKQSTSAAPREHANPAPSNPFPLSPPPPPPPPSPNVAIIWDLQTTKPPSTVPAYDAAVRLRLAASRFGPVRHSIAFYPPLLPPRRAVLPANTGRSFPTEPCVCGVCGRRFFDRPKLLTHFKELHQREHAKRLRRLESAKGSRRVNLAASMAAKMDKYRKAADALFSGATTSSSNDFGIVVPARGGAVFELADDLRRAGVRVRRVPAGLPPEVVSRALQVHVGEVVNRRAAGCLVLVSADPELVGVVRDARACGVKTIVVVGDGDGRQGDEGEGGMLKRWADAGFTWREVLSGKARDEAPKVTGRWKDKELLSRLEWKYRPEEERGDDNEFDVVLDQDSGIERPGEGDCGFNGSLYASVWKTDCDGRPWWGLDTCDSTATERN